MLRMARPAPRLPELLSRLGGPLAWLVVPAVALVVHLQPDRLQLGVRLLVGAGIVVAALRRPDLGVLALVVGLPIQLVGLSFLYANGVPGWIVRPLGLWKEAVVAGCVLAAVRAWRSSGVGADAVDWAAGAYLTVVGLYYLLPGAFVIADSGLAGPPTDRVTLNVALRTETLFVVLLVTVRHLDLGPEFRGRFARTVFAVGVVVAGVAIFELLFSDRWNALMVDGLQVPRYKLDVLGITSTAPFDVRVYGHVGGARVVRLGSLFLDQLQCGLWLVAPLAVGLHRLLRGARVAVAAGTAAVALALVGTQTRAALLAAIVAVVVVLRPHAGVDRAARARVAALVVVGVLTLLPVAAATGLVERTFGGAEGDDGSTQVHLQRSRAALETFLDRPFGRGLGTGANTATRFDVESGLLSENYYLQVANETGVASVVFFLILVVVAARRLGRHRHDGDLLAAAWRGVFLGLALAALLLHVWESLAVAWTVWIGVGLVLRPGGPTQVPEPQPQPREVATPTGVGRAPAPSAGPAPARPQPVSFS